LRHGRIAALLQSDKENAMRKRLFPSYTAVAAATAFATVVLTACGPRVEAAPLPPHRVAQADVHADLGRVTAIQAIHGEAKPSGAGAVIGGLAGGVIGNQIGHGTGRAAATAVGVAGGALVGNSIEKSQSTHVTGYRVTVRTDTGATRVFEAENLQGLKVGSRVRVDGGVLRKA